MQLLSQHSRNILFLIKNITIRWVYVIEMCQTFEFGIAAACYFCLLTFGDPFVIDLTENPIWDLCCFALILIVREFAIANIIIRAEACALTLARKHKRKENLK